MEAELGGEQEGWVEWGTTCENSVRLQYSILSASLFNHMVFMLSAKKITIACSPIQF
jgi:hypothetical protein